MLVIHVIFDLLLLLKIHLLPNQFKKMVVMIVIIKKVE
jgi:hypothetical protein